MNKLPYKSVKDYKNYVKNNLKDLRITSQGATWFIVADKDDYMAYFHALSSTGIDNPEFFELIHFSTVHKYNEKSGNGRVVFENFELSYASFENCLYHTIDQSRHDILCGHEINDMP